MNYHILLFDDSIGHATLVTELENDQRQAIKKVMLCPTFAYLGSQ